MAVIDSLRPSEALSCRVGVGGNVRELGSVSEKPAREGLKLAQDEVYSLLSKSRDLLVRQISSTA